MARVLAVRWDVSAVNDLENIYKAIGAESIFAARYVIQHIIALTKSLGTFPEKYPSEELLEGLDGNFRSVSIWSYKIVYEVTEEAVFILKIFNSLRDPRSLKEEIET